MQSGTAVERCRSAHELDPMNEATQTFPPAAFLSSARAASCRTGGRKHWQNIELAGFAVLLVALNWSLFQGVCNTRLMFMPEAARNGEWWRWFTHPFIHVTWWHLLLDGAA